MLSKHPCGYITITHLHTLEEQLSTGQGAACIALSQGMAQPLEHLPLPSERALKQKLMQNDRVRTKPHTAGQPLPTPK